MLRSSHFWSFWLAWSLLSAIIFSCMLAGDVGWHRLTRWTPICSIRLGCCRSNWFSAPRCSVKSGIFCFDGDSHLTSVQILSNFFYLITVLHLRVNWLFALRPCFVVTAVLMSYSFLFTVLHLFVSLSLSLFLFFLPDSTSFLSLSLSLCLFSIDFACAFSFQTPKNFAEILII